MLTICIFQDVADLSTLTQLIQGGKNSGKTNDYHGKKSKGRKAADIIPDSLDVINKHQCLPFTGKMVNVPEEIQNITKKIIGRVMKFPLLAMFRRSKQHKLTQFIPCFQIPLL